MTAGQIRTSNTGVIMVVGQKIALGHIHKHQTVTVLVFGTTPTIEFADGDVRAMCRTTTEPVHSIKGRRSGRRSFHCASCVYRARTGRSARL